MTAAELGRRMSGWEMRRWIALEGIRKAELDEAERKARRR
jgi:hypothetical protein